MIVLGLRRAICIAYKNGHRRRFGAPTPVRHTVGEAVGAGETRIGNVGDSAVAVDQDGAVAALRHR